MNKILYLFFFIFGLAIARLVPHPPNFTPILAFAIISPLLTKDRNLGMLLPVSAMFISDIFIGFHTYQFVVYATILSISFFTPMKKNYLNLSFIAILSSVWFFVSTNFAVWLMWDYYPKNLEGIIACYTMAIPFFKNTLISTLFFTGLLTFYLEFLQKLNEKTNHFILKFIK